MDSRATGTTWGVESTAYVVDSASNWPGCNRAVVLSDELVPGRDGNVGRLHIARTGHWDGHPSGAFDITEADIDCAISYFDAHKTPIPVDYNHASVRGLSAEDGKAAGWIRKLSKRVTNAGVELWADVVEWTDQAASMIKAGEYRFSSGVFLFGRPDPQSGDKVPARLLNVALTNVPFVDGLTAVQLSQMPQDGDEGAQEQESEPAEVAQPAKPAEPTDGEEKPVDPNDPASSPNDDEQAATLAMVDDFAKALGVNRARIVSAMQSHRDGFVNALRQIFEREQADSKQETVAMSTEVDIKVKEIAEKAKDAKLVELSQQVEDLLTREKKREEDAAKAAERAIVLAVDADIKKGRVQDLQRDDAIFVLSNRPEMYDRIYPDKGGVPVGRTQAGPEPTVDPKTVELDSLDSATRMAVEMTMGLTNFKTGKTFTVREAIERTVENMKTAQKAG